MSLSLPASSLQRSGFYSLHFKSHGPEGLQELGKRGGGGRCPLPALLPQAGPRPQTFHSTDISLFPLIDSRREPGP